MRKLMLAVAAILVLAGPGSANAGPLLELSVGSGFRFDPTPIERIPTNLMLTGGYSFAGVVKLELGAVANLGDVEHSDFEVDLRPMVVLAPPGFPLYLRGIFGVSGLVEGPRDINYGGALGTDFGLFGVGAFLEAGALSRRIEVPTPAGTAKDTVWMAEGRFGVYWD
jgi:hypothetical protein